ncbi:MAG: hypothetical protein GY751_25765 [Bacteroidetes bacterium]|nr:hypothetical protein [Bacteroidota bacterium]
MRSSLLLVLVLGLFSCGTDDMIVDDPIAENEVVKQENDRLELIIPTTTIRSFITGIITNESGDPLMNASVIQGDIEVFTDQNGRYTFGEIELKERFAMLHASKSGFLNSSRTFSPTQEAFNTVNFSLLEKGDSKNFDATLGGEVTVDEDIELIFTENSIVYQDGSPYSGIVIIYGRYIDPLQSNFADIMPGTLAGLSEEDEMQALISFGMFTIELEDPLGNDLEVAGNKEVAISLPVPDLINSPQDLIPLWHFNEAFGVWVESGMATKVSDRYIGTVNHFSTWNLDSKEEPFDAAIRLIDESNSGIANQDILIFSTNDNLLARVFTDHDGYFNLINAPQFLRFRLDFPCDESVIIEFEEDLSEQDLLLVADFSNVSSRVHTLEGQIRGCEDSIDFVYSDSYFSIISSDESEEHIYFGGLSDSEGNYRITTTFCDVDDLTSYEVDIRLNISFGNAVDSTFTLTFPGTEQSLDIDFCGAHRDTVISDDFVIVFVDPNLEQGVRDLINKPTGDIVFADVKDLTLANFSELEISNISGLEYFVSLERLIMEGNTITDISPVAALVHLTSLNLNWNSISDISSLSELVNLRSLQLYDNDIDDISSLEMLGEIVLLNLGVNAVSDLSVISGMTQLRTLVLFLNRIGDISPLESLSNLTFLNLDANGVSDLSPIENLVNIDELRLYNNLIDDISPLNGLINLTDLLIGQNSITNFSPLFGLTNLSKLEVSSNGIVDVTPFGRMAHLEYILLHNNSISDVTPLCNFGSSFTGAIVLSGNPLDMSDIDDLGACLPNAGIQF